jgi:hypothetical protein
MSNDPFRSREYREIQRDHLFRTLAFLLENGMEFAVAAEVEYMYFSPELPAGIRRSFAPVSLFVLSGYTFESAVVEEELLRFEAGFGKENVGAAVAVPLLAIRQIFAGERPVAVNIAEPAPDAVPADYGRSMEALLNNPENLKLLKKKKKDGGSRP